MQCCCVCKKVHEIRDEGEYITDSRTLLNVLNAVEELKLKQEEMGKNVPD